MSSKKKNKEPKAKKDQKTVYNIVVCVCIYNKAFENL